MGTIKLKNSSTPGKIPTTSQLTLGELAVNTADGKLYLKTVANSIVCVGSDSSLFLNRELNLTDLSNPTLARGALGLGNLATQNANAVALTGGSLSGTFSGNLTFSGNVTFSSALSLPGLIIRPTGEIQATGNGNGSVAPNVCGIGAFNFQTIRSNASQVPSGSYAVTIGNSNTASGTGSISLGQSCISSGNYALAAGNTNNASGATSVALGSNATASGTGAVSIGASNQANSTYTVALGSSNVINSQISYALGGNNSVNGEGSMALGLQNIATGVYSFAVGNFANARRNGEWVYNCGRFGSTGDSQASLTVLRALTSNATLTEFLIRDSFRIALQDRSTVFFNISVVARRTDGLTGESAAFQLIGAITRGIGNASTAIFGTVTKTIIGRDSAAWDVVVSADTTNGALRIQAQGEANKVIRWFAKCELTELLAA